MILYIYKNIRIAMRDWKLDAREGGKIISKKNRLNSAAADVEAATAFMMGIHSTFGFGAKSKIN